jgi:hypothetical protein
MLCFCAGRAALSCRRKIEMSPGVQSRDDTPRWPEPEEREFACIPAVKLSSAI